MRLKDLTSYIVYCSPAGTTRHTALMIAGALKAIGSDVHLIDLGKGADSSEVDRHITDGVSGCCIWIGTPVYAGHAVPPIARFIAYLPESTGCYAVPFVTWGEVTSGVALHEMGKALAEKGYTILGAAKIGAVHSMMWQSTSPLGEGHPDVQDDRMMEGLVATVDAKMRAGSARSLPLEKLNYQPGEVREWMQTMNIEAAKKMLPPLTLIEEKCTRCAICEKESPAAAITLNPYPRFGDACFMCYNCFRLCEEGAIVCDLSSMETMLKGKAAQNPELPLTQVFV